MKNILQKKVFVPVLALALFVGISGIAQAASINYYPPSRDCSTTIDNGNGTSTTYTGTTVYGSKGAIGCITQQLGLSTDVFTGGGSGSGSTGLGAIFKVFAGAYPDFMTSTGAATK